MTAKHRTPTPSPREEKPKSPDDAGNQRRESRVYTMLGIALVSCIVLMTNYLAFRHYTRFDWTTERRYTLSERSTEVLREINADLDIYLFVSAGEANYTDIRELLDRYRAASSHAVVHFVDAVRQRSEYEALASRYGLSEAMFADGTVGADAAILIASGDRRWSITRDDLVSIDFGNDSGEGPRLDTRAEQAITGGIVEVTLGRRTRICLTVGHGEWSLSGGTERNLSGFQDEMRRENLELEEFSIRGIREVPTTCDALFIIGPLQAFTTEESTLVREYVRHGGNLLFTPDAEIDRGEIRPTGLEDTLRDFGIRTDRALVLEMDPAHLNPGRPESAGPFYVTAYGDHPVTRTLQQLPRPTVFAIARPVRPTAGSSATTPFSASEQTFAETDIASLLETREPSRGEEDLPGPVSLGVAVRIEPDGAAPAGQDASDDENARGGRVVVVGDSDFLRTDALQAMEVANLELASAITGWLTAREALIAIPPRRQESQPIQLTQDDAMNLGFRVILLMPLAMVFLGLAVWWNRRA